MTQTTVSTSVSDNGTSDAEILSFLTKSKQTRSDSIRQLSLKYSGVFYRWRLRLLALRWQVNPANTHRVGLKVLAGFDHRGQRDRVVQQQPPGARLLQVGHPGGWRAELRSGEPSVSHWNTGERAPKLPHQQPSTNINNRRRRREET